MPKDAPVETPAAPIKVQCRYMGRSGELRAALVGAVGVDPVAIDRLNPSIGGILHEITVMTFEFANEDAARAARLAMAPVPGVEVL